MAMTARPRDAVEDKYKWRLEDLYPTIADWENDLAEFKRLIDELPRYRGKLGASAQTLLDYMLLNDRFSELADRLGNYAERKSDEDTRISENQALVARMTSTFVAAGEASGFEAPEILAIPDDTLERFYRENPALALYRRYLDRIRRRRAHILSVPEEKLLASAGEMAQTPDNIYSLYCDADMTFPAVSDGDGEMHPLSQGSYISLLESGDCTLRKNAFEVYYGVYAGHRNMLSATLAAQMKKLRFFSKARNYPSSIEAALDRNEVPVCVYDNLISAVNANMGQMLRYVVLRKKLLGVDELHFYDLYTPLVPQDSGSIAYEDAVETVLQALAPMGEEYVKLLREGFEGRWIDVYENQGKRSGAYSAGARVHPYVLLNYTGTLDSQFTIAHEMGHALHSWYSNHNQPIVYSDYVIFVAEVASTCNEALLIRHLLAQTADKRQRAYLINHFLEQFRGTLYRQTMFAEFERDISCMDAEGTPLTADTLSDAYSALLHRYFGDGIVYDPQIAMEWARIPHFYYNFYVYQYATGFAAAIALSKRILSGEAGAVDAYLGFLAGGCSKDPISLLRDAGVDMASSKPVEDALSLFGELLDEMEELAEEL